MTKVNTILCIPGNWTDRSEIVQSIAENSSQNFIFLGMILLNTETNTTFQIEIHERNELMKTAFEAAGIVNKVSKKFIEEIDSHKQVIYVIGETGNLEIALEIAKAGLAIIKAGGIGVKVESTGKAFTKEHWEELLTGSKEENLYEMFVIDSIHDGNGTIYSCGMHNLGYKDSIVSGQNIQESINLLSTFGYYQVMEDPIIKVNQTFSTAIDSPIYTILEETNQPYKGDELFENQFGM